VFSARDLISNFNFKKISSHVIYFGFHVRRQVIVHKKLFTSYLKNNINLYNHSHEYMNMLISLKLTGIRTLAPKPLRAMQCGFTGKILI
jgi:hypothetical protein